MQDVVELTDPDAPVKLNEDGILAIHVALGLSNMEMEKMQGLLVPTLDPHGTGTLTREAWRAVSAEWHASGRSFPDFVATRTNDASGGGGEEKEEERRVYITPSGGSCRCALRAIRYFSSRIPRLIRSRVLRWEAVSR